MYTFAIYGTIALIICLQMAVPKLRNRYLTAAVFLAAALIYGIRFNLGNDTNVYIMIFNRTVSILDDSIKWVAQRNIGYNTLLYVSKKLFHSYQAYVLVCNILVWLICSWVIWKNSKNVLLSLLLFIGNGIIEVYYGSGIRQMIAMAVFLFAFYTFLPKKQYGRYCIAILLALTFHEVALFVLPVPLLMIGYERIVRYEKRNLVILILLTAALALFLGVFMPWMIGKLDFGRMNNTLVHFCLYFLKTNRSFLGFAMEAVFLVMTVILFHWSGSKEKGKIRYTEFLVILLSVSVYVIFFNWSIVSRVCDFMQVIFVIMIPNMLMEIHSSRKRVLALAAVILLNGFLLYSDVQAKIRGTSGLTRNVGIAEPYPYLTVFSPEAEEIVEFYTGD